MPLIPGVEAGAAMAALEEKVRSGQAISLLELAEASQYLINKPYRKQSVIAQLHQKLPEQGRQQQDRQHKAPKKSAERGL